MPRYRDIFGSKRDPRGTRRWRTIRDMMLKKEPRCRYCNRLSETVHHIEPVIRRPDLFWTQSNLTVCCRDCHHHLDAGRIKPKPPPPSTWNGAM